MLLVVKNLSANTQDVRDTGLIPGLGGSPVEERSPGMETHSHIRAWRIPWTEELGGLQCMELQRVGQDCHNLAQAD